MPAALRRTMVVLVVALVALAVLAWPAVARPTGNVEDEAGFVGHIAAERAGAGLPALTTAADLVVVARRHAQRMADRGEHYHNPNLATEVSGWSKLGENVGQGYTVDGVHRAFMGSAPHRAIILDRDFTQLGVGVARSADGRIFVVEVFREPMPAAPPAPVVSGAAAAPVATKLAPARPPVASRPSPPPPPAPRVAAVVAPAEPVVLSAAIAPDATAVEAALTTPSLVAASLAMASSPVAAPASTAGPASVAAGLIATMVGALVVARRRLGST